MRLKRVLLTWGLIYWRVNIRFLFLWRQSCDIPLCSPFLLQEPSSVFIDNLTVRKSTAEPGVRTVVSFACLIILRETCTSLYSATYLQYLYTFFVLFRVVRHLALLLWYANSVTSFCVRYMWHVSGVLLIGEIL